MPRKKFPPPTTTASSAPVSTASTRSDAIRATVGACRPCASGPVRASPDSFTTTRRNMPAPFPDIMSCPSTMDGLRPRGHKPIGCSKKGGTDAALFADRPHEGEPRPGQAALPWFASKEPLNQAGDFGGKVRTVGAFHTFSEREPDEAGNLDWRTHVLLG